MAPGGTGSSDMESSIRKNWMLAVFLAACALLVGVLVMNGLANVRRSLLLKQTHNDLKWIGLALHNYHDTYGSFPPVVLRDGSGNSMHSWRSLIQVEMATIVETADRFDSYDLSQSWDSEANQKSVLDHRFGTHPYQILAVVGPNAAWLDEGTRSFSDFKDGAGNSILLIAVRNTGVAWHQPVDAVVSDSGTLSVNDRELDLSSDVFVVTVDGAVRYVANGIAPKTMSALLTINAGDEIAEW